MSESSQPDVLHRTAELLHKVRGGDEQAMNELFARYQGPLERWLHARLPGSMRGLLDTEDLVQEVLMRAFKAVDRFDCRGIGAFWAYLRQIGIRYVRDVGRRHEEQFSLALTTSSHSAPAAPGVAALHELIEKEELEAFDHALSCLSERRRHAVLLRLELGLDYGTIAADCGLKSAAAARMVIARALARVSQEVARARPTEGLARKHHPLDRRR